MACTRRFLNDFFRCVWTFRSFGSILITSSVIKLGRSFSIEIVVNGFQFFVNKCKEKLRGGRFCKKFQWKTRTVRMTFFSVSVHWFRFHSQDRNRGGYVGWYLNISNRWNFAIQNAKFFKYCGEKFIISQIFRLELNFFDWKCNFSIMRKGVKLAFLPPIVLALFGKEN